MWLEYEDGRHYKLPQQGWKGSSHQQLSHHEVWSPLNVQPLIDTGSSDIAVHSGHFLYSSLKCISQSFIWLLQPTQVQGWPHFLPSATIMSVSPRYPQSEQEFCNTQTLSCASPSSVAVKMM